jgi:hypothetical protein
VAHSTTPTAGVAAVAGAGASASRRAARGARRTAAFVGEASVLIGATRSAAARPSRSSQQPAESVAFTRDH